MIVDQLTVRDLLQMRVSGGGGCCGQVKPVESPLQRIVQSSRAFFESFSGGMVIQRDLLTVQELADYLAVPVATIYQWRYRSEGPHGFRVGRHLRYRWSEVEAWIEQQLQEVGP